MHYRSLLFVLLLLAGSASAQRPPASAYRFSYAIDTASNNPKYIRVHFRLINNSDSTLYFLRQSCSPANGLRWKERQWQHTPRVVCRASFPLVDTVVAHGYFEWTTFFTASKKAPVPEFTYTLARLRQQQKPGTLHGNEQRPDIDTIALRVRVPEAARQ
ncbi:hypothetical protein [Flaviaesturariibacter terrae]